MRRREMEAAAKDARKKQRAKLREMHRIGLLKEQIQNEILTPAIQ